MAFADTFAQSFRSGAFRPGSFRSGSFRSATPLDTAARLRRLKRLAWLMDGAFVVPGTRFRFGLNGAIGLLPGGGDLVLGAISLFIVYEAAQMGLPVAKLARMVGNVALETVGGSVPLLGDLFDMALKANLRNIAIIEEHFGAVG